MMKKIVYILLFLIGLVLLGSVVYLYRKPKVEVSSGEVVVVSEDEEGVSNGDEEDLASAIESLLIVKNEWTEGDNIVSVTEVSGDYARGSVGPAEGGPGGGMWFAAKVDGEWEIVWDGNGSIMCEDLTNYPEFPTDMISECWDASSGEMVVR